MAKYSYIDQTGGQKTFEAGTAEEALKTIPKDANPKSGVALETIKDTDPVVSSEDNATQFKEDLKKTSDLENGMAKGNEENKTKDQTLFGTGEENKKTGKVETTGDPVLDQMNKANAEKQKELEKEEKRKKKEYNALYQTTLSAIDSTVSATIDDLNSTYDQTIQEQKRINELNIARVKAYGLGGGGAYTPISFGDAVTNREREASDKIKTLNTQRNSLIAKARALADSGRSQALRDNLENLRKVEDEIRTKLKEAKDERDAQYKLWRDSRKEEEDRHKEQVEEMSRRLASIAPSFYDEYSKMGENEKAEYLKKISIKYDLDYDTAYGIIENSGLDLQKKKASIESENALAYQRRQAGNKDANETKMKGELPADFKMSNGKVDMNDAESKRKAYVKKYGAEGKKYWDDVFKNEQGMYDYDNYGEKKEGETGDVQTRTEKAGLNYEALRAKGISDDEIDKQLREKGY